MHRLFMLLPIVSTGCVTNSPVAPELTLKRCHELGVHAGQNDPMMPVVSETSTTLGGVAKNCGGDELYFTKMGCIKPDESGKNFVIYHSGPESRDHEWCHAWLGPRHSRPWMPFGEEYGDR